MNLSRSVEIVFRPLIDIVISGSVPYFANPMFAGSIAIGGADADFVIGDTLFELKAIKALAPAAVRKALQQLVGYCLLDLDDRYGIRSVGVYFVRQEWVCSWPLWRLVFPSRRCGAVRPRGARAVGPGRERSPLEATVPHGHRPGRAGRRFRGGVRNVGHRVAAASRACSSARIRPGSSAGVSRYGRQRSLELSLSEAAKRSRPLLLAVTVSAKTRLGTNHASATSRATDRRAIESPPLVLTTLAG